MYCYRLIFAVVFVGLMFSCNSSTIETATSSFDTSVGVVMEDTSPVKVVSPGNVHNINPDSLTAKELGEMILAGKLQPSDNSYTFRMMDSLQAIDKSDRIFYFKVFNKIMNHADGALGDAVGNYVVTYVEQNPGEFIENIKAYPADRFETWATHVGIELFLSANEPKDNYNKFSKSTMDNCRSCSKATVNRLRQFNTLVWRTLDQNVKAEKREALKNDSTINKRK